MAAEAAILNIFSAIIFRTCFYPTIVTKNFRHNSLQLCSKQQARPLLTLKQCAFCRHNTLTFRRIFRMHKIKGYLRNLDLTKCTVHKMLRYYIHITTN